MKTGFSEKLLYASVPLALLGEGVVFHVIFRMFSGNGEGLGTAASFLLALFLFVAGMFLLRKVPRRTLIISSAAASAVALLINVLQLAAFVVQEMRAVLAVFGIYLCVPFNLTVLPGSVFDCGDSPEAAWILTVVEIMIPMLCSFSGIFAGRTAETEKTHNNKK